MSREMPGQKSSSQTRAEKSNSDAISAQHSAGELRLSSAERRRLRGAAHDLKPVVQLGKNGADDSALQEIDRALEHHELIKVRFVSGQEERREVARAVAARLGCAVVGTIGHVAILYRPTSD